MILQKILWLDLNRWCSALSYRIFVGMFVFIFKLTSTMIINNLKIISKIQLSLILTHRCGKSKPFGKAALQIQILYTQKLHNNI
jgi:hypothetical protein